MAECYPLEAFLRTTLSCFYDQECIDMTGSFRSLPTSSLASSRYSMITTLEVLVSELMIENYETVIWYEKYFKTCAASLCTYTTVERRSAMDAIASLVSLYGGLVIITRCLAVITVKVWLLRKNRVQPVISS